MRPGPAIPAILLLLSMPCRAVDGPAPIPWLPEPVTNNAVARVEHGEREYLVSLLGLGAGKTWRDLEAGGHVLDPGADAWADLPPVPDRQGRLAAAMTSLRGEALVFGGYTVAEDGTEVSTPFVYALNPATRDYRRLADMPVPVDDSVALAHRNRFAYLVSGWHDTDNVPLVQVYDAVEDRWFEATPYPGSPVFGHSGVIHDGRLLVCDGVRVDRAAGRRSFVATDECWLGAIDPLDPARIDWQRAPPHPGPPRYRMAAAARPGKAEAVFAGGSANPYNYDGIGYDGRPAEPERSILVFDFGSGAWRAREDGPATMDHRGLLPREGGFAVVGGMRAGQAVWAGVEVFSID